MSYSLRGHEGGRNNYFRKIQLVGQKYWDKQLYLAKRDSAAIVWVSKPALFATSGL